MLKRPGFICELLTDSGYHLRNCATELEPRGGVGRGGDVGEGVD